MLIMLMMMMIWEVIYKDSCDEVMDLKTGQAENAEKQGKGGLAAGQTHTSKTDPCAVQTHSRNTSNPESEMRTKERKGMGNKDRKKTKHEGSI